MLHPADEEVAIGYAKLVLTQISNEFVTAQSLTKETLGGECGRRPLVYDNAKQLARSGAVSFPRIARIFLLLASEGIRCPALTRF